MTHLRVELVHSLGKGQSQGGGCCASCGGGQELRGLGLQRLGHAGCEPVVRGLQDVAGGVLETRVQQDRARAILVEGGWKWQLRKHCKIGKIKLQ